MIRKAERQGKHYLNPVPTSVGSWSTFLKAFLRYITNREETTPKRQLGPFSTDVRVFQNPPASGLRITWMGHSSMLVEIDGARVLIDPVWDLRAAPVAWMGPKRFFPAPLPLEQLPAIDVVLLSHDHYDHLGAQTVRRLSQMTANYGNAVGHCSGGGDNPSQAGRKECARTGLDREPAGGPAHVDSACRPATFPGEAHSIDSKRFGLRLFSPGHGIGFITELIRESGKERGQLPRHMVPSISQCWRLVLTTRCGRTFIWAPMAR